VQLPSGGAGPPSTSPRREERRVASRPEQAAVDI